MLRACRRRVRTAGLATAALAVTVISSPSPAHAAGGPSLLTPESKLAAAVHCDDGIGRAGKTPLLFIPGTTVTGDENFAWNFIHAMKAQGRPSCWVDYPDRGWKDLQVSAEYVVHAIRATAAKAGRKISLVGHSQGGLQAVWAMRFWPDLKDKVDDVITLGSPVHGSVVATAYCAVSLLTGCPEAFRQFTWNSRWSQAVLRDPLPAGPSFTQIYTKTDEFAAPGRAASELPGATQVGVQDICPLRPVGHLQLAVDNVSYHLALDALDHEGPSVAARISTSTCAGLFMPLDVPELVKQLPGLATSWIWANLSSHPWVRSEPALRDYAR